MSARPLLVGLLSAAILLPATRLDARARRRQAKPKPPVVVAVDEGDDPAEALEEARRRAGNAPVRLVPATKGARGPAGAAPLALAPLAAGDALRPKDVVVTNPAYDGFPSFSHTEPSIAAQGDVLVCVYNDGGADVGSANPAVAYNADGFSVSTDGGAAFTDQGKRAPLGSLTTFLGDNVVAAGADGDFFYVSDAGRNEVFFNTIAVSRSTNGGRSWSAPTDPTAGVAHRFADGFFDKPWIAVDTSSGPTRGNVYVTWSDFSFTGFATDLWSARSTDHGATWLAKKLDSFSYPVAVTYVQTAKNGTVWVGEQDEGAVVNGQVTGTNWLRASTDAGATWSAPKKVGTYLPVGDAKAQALCGDPTFFGGLVRYLNGPIEADSSLRIAVDPSDATGRTVFVATQAVPADRPGDGSDVFLWRTTDGGATFSAPLRVNDDATRNDQFMPDLWAAPDGTLGVLWLDRRNDPANWRLEAWMAISRDHGASFGPSFPVSSAPFPPSGTCQMSDYNGVFADAHRFALAWGDAREVDPARQLTQQVRAATVPLAGPGPLLALESFDIAADRHSLRVRLRNDGSALATGLSAVVVVEGDVLLPPAVVTPVPDIAAGHGAVDVLLPAFYSVPTPYVKARVQVWSGADSVSFPVAWSLAPGGNLGKRLSVDFETATSDFTPEPGSLWHTSSVCAARDPGHSGTHVAYFGLDSSCSYDAQIEAQPIRVFGGLVSKPVFLPRGAALLRFNEWIGIPARYRSDHAGLQISTDGGVSFENAWGYGKMSRFSPPASLALTGSDGRPTWHPVELDLSDYSGKEIVLRFWFNGIGNTLGGYAIDDVELFAVSEGSNAALGTCDAPMAVSDVPSFFATAGSATPSPVVPPCAPGTASNPFWLEVVPASSGTLAIDMSCADALISAWSGPRCGELELLACGVPAGCGPKEPMRVPASAGVPIRLLVTSAQPVSASISATLLGAERRAFLPVVLDLVSGFGAYTSELALTNRASTSRVVRLTYTAMLGSGSGSGSIVETIGPRRQLLLPNALAFLRARGLAIPQASAGQQAGTLVVSWPEDGDAAPVDADVRVLSPTSAPQAAGSASVSYTGALGARVFSSAVVAGLRSSAAERSKVAVFNPGDAAVTVRLTAFAGDGSGRSAVVRDALVVPARGWTQIEDALGAFSNGWVSVETVAGAGFGAYGVVNDAFTNDGSLIPAGAPAALSTVPVVVETGRFTSELALTNPGPEPSVVTLRYRESLDGAGGGGAAVIALPARSQRLIPSIVDFLRKAGVAIGPVGRSYAGSLRVEAAGGAVVASARTVAPSPAGGAFGLFTPAASGANPTRVALSGLHADATTRSNVAVVNAGSEAQGPISVSLQSFDGDTGLASGPPLALTLPPGAWAQPYRFFTLANGWVEVTRTSGTAPWLAYAVLNDGAEPGQRTDDGAYVPASE